MIRQKHYKNRTTHEILYANFRSRIMIETLKWIDGIDGYLELIDQRKLPGEFIKIQCRNIEQLYEAIKTLAIRGAPAIGVAAGYGLSLAMQKLKASTHPEEAVSHLETGENVQFERFGFVRVEKQNKTITGFFAHK